MIGYHLRDDKRLREIGDMIEAFAGIFAGYAGYAGWPWWTATIVGALSGFQVANARLYQGHLKERIEAGDPAVSSRLFQMSLIGVAIGAAIATAIYFGISWIATM
ncbi:MAG: hypothetical protein ACI9XZ_001390 [Alphaproteobacteria bacterium]